MSKTQEVKHVEKLGIATLGIDGIRKLIENDVRLSIVAMEKGMKFEKCTFHIIGPAGVGKTQICYQIAENLSKLFKVTFEVMMIKAPVLSRDDMIIPFPVIDNGRTDFKMLYSDFIPKEKDSYGLFVIDEFSRGDHTFQQLMWQVQNEYSLHLHKFPKKWFVISIDNPDDQEYSMDTLEDAAGMRRMIHVYVEVNPLEFLNYAKKAQIHPLIIDYIEAKPDKLYDFESQKKGAVYANPASWEKLSDHLKKFDLDGGWNKHMDEIDVISSGLINSHHTRLFREFAMDLKDVTPKDIFNNYNKVRPIVLEFVKKGNNTKLAEIVKGFFTFISNSRPVYSEVELLNIINFLTDMPIDTAAVFITDVDNLGRGSEEYKYMTKLHVSSIKYDKYKTDFYEKLANISDKKISGK